MSNRPRRQDFVAEIDGLDAGQKRQLKCLVHLLKHVLSTESEQEFFDNSAEAMRLCAALVKQSKFIKDNKLDDIPYATQVLEYSLEMLNEQIDTEDVVRYDC